jgi:hypothetical protein
LSGMSNITTLTFKGFDNDPSWAGWGIFVGWRTTTGGTVTTSDGAWTSAQARAYAISKGLSANWAAA